MSGGDTTRGTPADVSRPIVDGRRALTGMTVPFRRSELPTMHLRVLRSPNRQSKPTSYWGSKIDAGVY